MHKEHDVCVRVGSEEYWNIIRIAQWLAVQKTLNALEFNDPAYSSNSREGLNAKAALYEEVRKNLPLLQLEEKK